MRCPLVVGRDDQLQALREAVEGARASHGSWVTVAGEAGVGKSRLLEEAAGYAVGLGALVVAGRCSAVDALTPFRPFAEILLRACAELPRPQDGDIAPFVSVVARFVPHWRSAGDWLMDAPAVIAESVLRVLGWVAAGRPAVMILDDLHWADAETLAVCDYLIDHLGETSLTVLASVRPEEVGRAPGRLSSGGRVVILEPLDSEAVTRMAEACLGGPPSEAQIERLQEVAGGLPLLVEDLLGGGRRFEHSVAARLAALSPAGQRVVLAVALVGDQCSLDLLVAATGEPLTAIASAVHEATGAALLAGKPPWFTFRHEMTREAVLAAVAGLRWELLPKVAEALAASGRDDELGRAGELWLEYGQPARAAEVFRAAAATARARGAPDAAIRLLERAAAATVPAVVAEVELARLELLARHGRPAEAVEVGQRLLAQAEGGQRVRALLARSLLEVGRSGEAMALLDGADVDAETLVLQARAVLASSRPDRRLVAEHLARQAAGLAEQSSRAQEICDALELIALCARSRSLAEAEDALRRLLATAEASGLSRARLRALNELGTIEMLARAEGHGLDLARAVASEAGALDIVIGVDVNLASLYAMRYELDECRRAAGRAQELARRLGLAPLAAAAIAVATVAAGFEGRQAELEAGLREAAALSPGDEDLRAFGHGVGRGMSALLREDRALAVRCFEQAARPDAPVGSLDVAWGPLLVVLAAEGAATEEHLGLARRFATPGAAWSDTWLGYGEAAVGRDTAAFDEAERAAARYPLFQAIGRRLVAEAALHDGWGSPVDWLRAAEAVFIAGHHTRSASACQSLLRSAGAPRPGDGAGIATSRPSCCRTA